MNEPKDKNLPTSFTSITQWDDQSFFQYLEGHCSKIEKDKLQNIQRSRKINFFIQEEQQNNQTSENAFQHNFVIPSINFFSQSKELKQTLLESRNELQMMQLENEIKIQTNFQFKQKNRQNNQTRMFIRNNNLRTNQTKNISEINTKNFNREKRLNEIITQTTSIKEQIQSTMNYFMEVMNKTGPKLQNFI